MTTPTYSDNQRKYWTKRPANVLQYLTAEFYHPDFDYIRLVQNQYTDKTFDVDGTNEVFTATSMKIPVVTSQSTDTTQAGSILFGRIGSDVRQKLMMITPMGSINYPIQVTLRHYENGITAPIYERRLYADKNGIAIGADNVSVKLSVNNPAKVLPTAKYFP